MDHSYETNGNDQMELDVSASVPSDDHMESKNKTRKALVKPSQFNCRFCESKYTSKKRLVNHMKCHGECEKNETKQECLFSPKLRFDFR